MKEYGEKIPAEKKAPIEASLEKLKAAHKSQDIAAIDIATTEMNAAWATASEDMYKDTQAGAQPGAEQANGAEQPQSGADASENVTDAEFEEVK